MKPADPIVAEVQHATLGVCREIVRHHRRRFSEADGVSLSLQSRHAGRMLRRVLFHVRAEVFIDELTKINPARPDHALIAHMKRLRIPVEV